PVRQKCRLIALATGTIGLNLCPPSGGSRRAPVAGRGPGLLDVVLGGGDGLHPADHVRPLPRPPTVRRVPTYGFKISWSVPTYRLDWIVQGYAGPARWHLWG